MTDHDPLCTYPDKYSSPSARCDCDVIARVRERIAQAIESIPGAVDGGPNDTIWNNMIWKDTAAKIARGNHG